jgi:hypothetical protein
VLGVEKEFQFGRVAPEHGRPSQAAGGAFPEAETMIFPLTPDEALVVDVARGLDSGSMVEQARRILMQAPYSVGYHREEGNVEDFVWACVLAILRVGLLLEVRRGAPGGCTGKASRFGQRTNSNKRYIALYPSPALCHRWDCAWRNGRWRRRWRREFNQRS